MADRLTVDGEPVITEDESSGDVGGHFDSVDADAATTGTLDVDDFAGSNVPPSGKVSFASEFVGDVLPDATHDPEIISGTLFDDGDHRVIAGNANTGNTYLYRTSNFDTFGEIASDILPNVGGTGQVAGATILNDGTAIFLESRDTNTILHSGSSLTSLSEQGEFCPEPDGGIFYDRDEGVLHYYPEDADTAEGVSSPVISHWTASDGDLLNATQQADAIDVRDYGSWKTGDPEIIKLGDWYYMFLDNTSNHPQYHIALAVGRTLDSFELVSANITPDAMGGDLTVVYHDGYLEGLTEYSQDTESIGHWRLWPRQQSLLDTDNVVQGTSGAGPAFVDGMRDVRRAAFEYETAEFGEWSLNLYPDPRAGSRATHGIRLYKGGSEVGNFVAFEDEARLQSAPDNRISVTTPESGQTELYVESNRVGFNKFINMAPQSTPPSNPTANDIYLDDGANTADGNEGFRRYDGSVWVDIG